MSPLPSSRHGVWRALAVSALPGIVPLWALWSDLYVLEADGVHRAGGPEAGATWAVLSAASVALGASFWLPSRPVRILAYTLFALVLSVAFGVAGVLGVMHAFGGPAGNLGAPTWALVGLAGVSAWCVASLLATAALIVEDIRAGDAEAH